MWADLQSLGFNITELHATIDGKTVLNLDPATTPYRVCAGPVSRCSAPSFSVTLPTDNFFGLAADTYSPAVADGAYLLLAPLTPGDHKITFGGTSSFGTQDITYTLHVS